MQIMYTQILSKMMTAKASVILKVSIYFDMLKDNEKICQKYTLEYNPQLFASKILRQQGESKDNNPMHLTQMQ